MPPAAAGALASTAETQGPGMPSGAAQHRARPPGKAKGGVRPPVDDASASPPRKKPRGSQIPRPQGITFPLPWGTPLRSPRHQVAPPKGPWPLSPAPPGPRTRPLTCAVAKAALRTPMLTCSPAHCTAPSRDVLGSCSQPRSAAGQRKRRSKATSGCRRATAPPKKQAPRSPPRLKRTLLPPLWRTPSRHQAGPPRRVLGSLPPLPRTPNSPAPDTRLLTSHTAQAPSTRQRRRARLCGRAPACPRELLSTALGRRAKQRRSEGVSGCCQHPCPQQVPTAPSAPTPRDSSRPPTRTTPGR